MKKLFVLLLLGSLLYWWMLPNIVQGPSSNYEFEYITRISGNGDSSGTLPMVIALHGNGDTPDNFFDTLLNDFDYPARFVLLRGPKNYGGRFGGRAWPMNVSGLQECGDALADSTSVLLERFPTEGRPILLGFSGGAYVAYYLATFHADLFSYIFPLSGGLPEGIITSETASHNNGTKVIAFHGNKDQLVAFNRGKAAVESLREKGVFTEFVTLNGGHLEVFLSSNSLLLKRLSDAVNGGTDRVTTGG